MVSLIREGVKPYQRYIAGKRLQAKLSQYRYLTPFDEFKFNTYQLIYRVVNRLLLKEKKRLHSSGFMVANYGSRCYR